MALRTGRTCLSPFNKSPSQRQEFLWAHSRRLAKMRTEMLQLAHILPFFGSLPGLCKEGRLFKSKHTVWEHACRNPEVTQFWVEATEVVLGIQRSGKHQVFSLWLAWCYLNPLHFLPFFFLYLPLHFSSATYGLWARKTFPPFPLLSQAFFLIPTCFPLACICCSVHFYLPLLMPLFNCSIVVSISHQLNTFHV